MKPTEKIKALEAITAMLAGFPSIASNITEATGEAYLRAVEDCSLAAIEAACSAYLKGQVGGQDSDFVPSAPKLAWIATALDEAAVRLSGQEPKLVPYRIGAQPPDGCVPLGPVDTKRARKMLTH